MYRRVWSIGSMTLLAAGWLGLVAASAVAVVALTAPAKPIAGLSMNVQRSLANRSPSPLAHPDAGIAPVAEYDPPAASNRAVSPLKSVTLKTLLSPASRAEEKSCLAEVVYFEGRGQPVSAQIALGQTVINRLLSGVYPKSLCAIAHQHDARDSYCQYSFACDGLSSVPKDQTDWDLAVGISEKLLRGEAWLPEIGDATHFHPLTEHPAWVKYLQRVKRIGAIVFYRGNFSKTAMSN